MIRKKSFIYKTRLQISNLSFKFSFESPSRTISFVNNIYLGGNSWMCYVSTSKIKVKRYGIRIESWCNPIVMGKSTVSPLRVHAQIDTPSYIYWIARI